MILTNTAIKGSLSSSIAVMDLDHQAYSTSGGELIFSLTVSDPICQRVSNCSVLGVICY